MNIALAEQTTKLNYHSNLKIWDKKSSIRSRPRRLLNKSEKDQLFFPISKQPLVSHPILQKLGNEAIRYILIQTVYNSMFDISIIETEMVNKGALMVANDQLEMGFDAELRHDALSVIIDEAYHAHVAVDYMQQVANATGIQPIEMPKKSAVMNAHSYIKTKVVPHLIPKFELLAVCVSEHVLTHELIAINKHKDVGQFFQEIMTDHLLDEGRHAILFGHILTCFWQKLAEEEKDILGPLLPEFMREYCRTDIQQKYERQILASLNLSENEIDTIIDDIYLNDCTIGFNNKNPKVQSLMTLLQRSGVLNHLRTNESFKLALPK